MVSDRSVTFIKRALNKTKCSLEISIIYAVYGENYKWSVQELQNDDKLSKERLKLFQKVSLSDSVY